MSRSPPLSVLSLVLGLAPTAVALAAPVGTGQPEHLYFADDGVIPNSRLPVLLYRQIPLEGTDRAAALERYGNPQLRLISSMLLLGIGRALAQREP